MNKIILFLALMYSVLSYGQSSEKYNSEYENFFRAEELYEKAQYAAARREFRNFIDEFDHPNDPMYIKASYYEAISALELYNNDAVTLLLAFNKNYPESIYLPNIYFKLGKYYYYKKKYKDALAWFSKLTKQDVDEDNQDEYFFKIGYANFKLKNFVEARGAFYEIKDGSSQYASPALYYFSYIAYQDESYQLALDGFLKLQDNEQFGNIVPYYIAQIYYLQGKYEELTEYAPKVSLKKGSTNESNLNFLIGDAYYRIGKYAEAVPYLEKYNKVSKTTRDEDYRLGFAYYKSNKCNKAIPLFDKVKKIEDSLGQAAYYHIAECMLKLENLVSARSAFEGAAFIDMDPKISKDALYNYAILSYKLDINPYNEAVEAFELYLSKYPNSDRRDDIYQYLVNVYTSTNNYSEALISLNNLPVLDINLKTAYQLISFNQGVKRFQQGNYQGAIQSFDMVKKYPIDGSILGQSIFWIADAEFRLQHFDDAISKYKAFVTMPSVNPNLQSEARYNIGYAYLKKADIYHNQDRLAKKREMLDKAIESFRLFIQGNPPGKQKEADANIRIADAYYVKKENEQAVKFYKETVSLNSGYEDQALFYMAKTYGYMDGKLNNKISTLSKIIDDYKDSKYLLAAIQEIAKSYMAVGQFDKALTYFNQIIFDYPSSALVVDAKINAADIYFKQGKYSKAETGYLDVMEKNGSDQAICKRVAEGLKDLYIAMDQLEKIDALESQYACVSISADEKENLYYLPAIELYGDDTKSDVERYGGAIPKFEKYLEKFPTGRYKNDVQNYLADCHYNLGQIDIAIPIYRETLQGPTTGFSELAASRVSHYLYNEGSYEEVIPYYKLLTQISSNPEAVTNAEIGLMRSYFLIENWLQSSIYADLVIGKSQTNNELLLEAYYAKGMSNFNLDYYGDAKSALEWVTDNTTTQKAAEAKFSLAIMEYKQDNIIEADEEIAELLKMKPTYNYWVARGLILRTRILIQLEDLFEAEQNLKSVIDHYPIEDDGVLDEANQLWDELMQLKDKPKEIEEEVDPIIEIEEDGGN